MIKLTRLIVIVFFCLKFYGVVYAEQIQTVLSTVATQSLEQNILLAPTPALRLGVANNASPDSAEAMALQDLNARTQRVTKIVQHLIFPYQQSKNIQPLQTQEVKHGIPKQSQTLVANLAISQMPTPTETNDEKVVTPTKQQNTDSMKPVNDQVNGDINRDTLRSVAPQCMGKKGQVLRACIDNVLKGHGTDDNKTDDNKTAVQSKQKIKSAPKQNKNNKKTKQ